MGDGLIVPVGDLLGSPGRERPFAGSRPVRVHLGEVVVDGPMEVSGRVVGLIDAVRAEFVAGADIHLVCVRCLVEWDQALSVTGEQYFRSLPDEDGYRIERDAVDVGGPAQDELALALPLAPLCRLDCRGLCPTCGTDLNTDPCDGHGEVPDSPFAVLRDLFDS